MVVGILVDKVQKFIYQRIDDTKSNNLNDSKTLAEIVKSSEAVKICLNKYIENYFRNNYIVNASGKVILIVDKDEKTIKDDLNKFFKQVYYHYQGMMFPIYIYFKEEEFEAENGDERKLRIIQKAESEWKNINAVNKVIQEQRDIIFNFLKDGESQISETLYTNIKKAVEEDYKNIRNELNGIFARSMDDIVDIFNEERKKIAIVKADLDNMNKLFQSIQNYEEYDGISKMLSEIFSPKYFAHVIGTNTGCLKELKGSILPFYIAGDDVFFAVPIEKLFLSIRLLKKILDDANLRIAKIQQEIQHKNSTKQVDEGKENKLNNNETIELKLSVGVCFTDSHLPVRYYHAEVEKQLSCAKKKMKNPATENIEPTSLKQESKSDSEAGEDNKKMPIERRMGLSISDSMFFSYIGEGGKKKADGINRFIGDIKELKYLKNKNVFTNSFIHNLIQILEKEKIARKRISLFLYYAMPNLDAGNKEHKMQECLFKLYLFRKFNDTLFNPEKKKKQYKEDDDKEINRMIDEELIPLLKIILLLTDDKYNDKEFEIKDRKFILNEDNELFIKSRLFSRPTKYIFDRYKKNEMYHEIFRLFVQEGESVPGEKFKKYGYKKAAFNSSFFYRVKNLLEANKKEKIFLLFENYIKHILNNKTDEESAESKYRLNFTLESLQILEDKMREMPNSEIANFFDDLIIFYQYNELKVKYLEIEKSAKGEQNVKQK